MTPSAVHRGRTYPGRLKGEKTPDCGSATNGRPLSVSLSHSGMWGSERRVTTSGGWNCSGASTCSKFEPATGTSAGRVALQGVAVHR